MGVTTVRSRDVAQNAIVDGRGLTILLTQVAAFVVHRARHDASRAWSMEGDMSEMGEDVRGGLREVELPDMSKERSRRL